MLMQEIRDDRNEWKGVPCLWAGRMNTVKILLHQKSSIESMQSLSIFQCIFFYRSRKNIRKIYMDSQETPKSQRNPETKEQS